MPISWFGWVLEGQFSLAKGGLSLLEKMGAILWPSLSRFLTIWECSHGSNPSRSNLITRKHLFLRAFQQPDVASLRPEFYTLPSDIFT